MNVYPRYRDRADAGRTLALALHGCNLRGDPLVLGLPRGGVPVAFELADAIRAPLEVFLVRKLGLPGQPEFAMGAIASGGVCLLNEKVIADARVRRGTVERVIEVETQELQRREQTYGSRPDPARLRTHPVILVDDGLATGFTMRAAITALRRLGNRNLTVAVPVGARSTCRELAGDVEQLVCPLQPDDFRAVGLWYEDFAQTTDAQVNQCLAQARRSPPGGERDRDASFP